MVSIGRRHIAFDPEFDLAVWGMRGHSVYQGKYGPIHIGRLGRIVWMTLPRGKHAN